MEVGAIVAPWLLCLHAWGSPRLPFEARDEGAATAVVVRTLARAPGPVISEDPGLVPTAGSRSATTIRAHPDGRSEKDGTRGHSSRHCTGESFSFIVLRFDPWSPSHRDPEGTWAGGRFTDEMVTAMRDSYQVADRYYAWVILRPLERDGAAGAQ